ncbi:MAG: hypothetical protein AAGA30_00515 [Planctomycetota bacterium]
MEWLEKISVTCFTASYLVVFAIEVSRAVFISRWWKWATTAMTTAGLFAHLVYLGFQKELIVRQSGLEVAGWTGWFLVASAFVMIAYLWILLRQRESIIGLFLIPVALTAIAIGNWPGQLNSFTVRETRNLWNTVHGLSFLLSTVIVSLGFLFGSLYLIQSRRLKKNRVLILQLPSLEWLQKSGEKALIASAALLTVGVISGFAINGINRTEGVSLIPWTDPVILSSAILLAWLLMVLSFNWFYRPARQGKKISYLVVACFLFLLIEIGVVLYSGHATDNLSADHSQAISLLDRNEVVQ